MNKLKSLFLGLGLALTGTLSTSCGLMGSEESLFIDSILASPQADGTTIIKITFTDEDIRPVEFVIPAGQDGEQGPKGTGIASVSSKVSEDGKDLVITMTYSDASLAPSVWTIPNATSITNIESMYDEESGMTTVTITTNDGEAHEFELPKGRDGNGVANVSQTKEENGDIVITITYTDPSVEPSIITLPYRNGEDGRGITSIVAQTDEDAGMYYLQVSYTEGEPEILSFPMPDSGTVWFYDAGAPTFVPDAKSGDFYFDTSTGTIYIYDNGFWNVAVRLTQPDVTVTFDAATNGGRISGQPMATVEMTVAYGSSIAKLPYAIKDGCDFVGWYTSQLGLSDPTSGKLTDLTPITRSLTVYACFQEVGA